MVDFVDILVHIFKSLKGDDCKLFIVKIVLSGVAKK